MIKEILTEHKGLRDWVDYFLRPSTFEIKVDRRGIGKGTKVGGNLQGSPLSSTLFTTYMSAVVREAERELVWKEVKVTHRTNTRGGGR